MATLNSVLALNSPQNSFSCTDTFKIDFKKVDLCLHINRPNQKTEIDTICAFLTDSNMFNFQILQTIQQNKNYSIV